jgi:hypothetical protein
MEINGKYYHDPDIQLRELKIAVDRLPFDAALRPHFDFLFGYIAALQDEIIEHERLGERLNDSQTRLGVAHLAVENAVQTLGEDAGDNFEDAVTKLIELAQKKAEPVERELMAVRL